MSAFKESHLDARLGQLPEKQLTFIEIKVAITKGTCNQYFQGIVVIRIFSGLIYAKPAAWHIIPAIPGLAIA